MSEVDIGAMPGSGALTVFGDVVPHGAVLCEVAAPEAPDELFAEESALVRDVSAGRRLQFAAARTCARRALGRLGFDAVPILVGPGREPIWPEGSVGSITHCPGYCAAAVGRSRTYLAMGIDAEPNLPLPPGLLDMVALPCERDDLRQLGPQVAWDRLLFCLKEAVYKVWYPMSRTWLGFDQARIDIDAASGTFRATALVDGPEPVLAAVHAGCGRFAVTDDLLFGMLTVPRVAV